MLRRSRPRNSARHSARRRWTSAVAAGGIAVTATIGVACSSGELSTRNADCASPDVTPDSVSVGLIFPDTGQVAVPFLSARSGVQARIDQANAEGGVHGRQVRLEWRDDASDGASNLTAAQDLVGSVGVFGVIQQSANVTGSADYLDQQGVPVVGTAAEQVWDEHRNMFAVVHPGSPGPAAPTFGAYARNVGGTRAYLLYSPLSQSARTMADQFATSLAAQGVEVVGRGEYTDGVTIPERVAADLASVEADVLYGAISGDGLALVLRAARAANVGLKTAVGPDGYNPALLATYGAAVAGMSVFVETLPFEAQSAALDRFGDAMARYAPELSNPEQPTALHGYVSADLFLHGLELAGACPTRSGFIEALRTTSGYDAGGLLAGPLDTRAAAGTVGACFTYVRVNVTGDAFEAVPNPQGTGTDWCGDLPGTTTAAAG